MSASRAPVEAGPIGRAPRVLILTAAFGSGHNAAAAALDAACRAAGASTRMVDHFRELVHPAFDRWSRWAYDAVLYRAPALWGLAFWLGDRMGSSSRLTLDINRLGSAALARLLAAERPDCVVCTHPTPAGALGRLRARGISTPPYAIVFSDFVAHRQWIHPEADLHVVPAEALGREVVARGIPVSRVVAAGIPVGPEFAEPLDRARARAALGLDPRVPLVLAMAGTYSWMGRLEAVTRVLLRLPPPLRALVVTGRDHELAARLRARVPGDGRIGILGYADNVRQLMAAADLLVTKAGGLSLAEALAAELPIVCFGSVPGHEARNAAFVVSEGAALAARSEADLETLLHRALARPDALDGLRAGIRALRRPHAAREIAERMLALAGRGAPGRARSFYPER
jgi:processive 1,2-diacylglycerol beta-glucosyltransferase